MAGAAVTLAAQTGDGKLAVIVPHDRLDDLAAAVTAALPGTAIGADPDLTSPVVVLTVRQAKGLEFDSRADRRPGASWSTPHRAASTTCTWP